LELLLPTTDEDVGWPKDDLDRNLVFSLMKRTYIEPWQVHEACEVIGSEKKVEQKMKDISP
jgi:hypothetical protein